LQYGYDVLDLTANLIHKLILFLTISYICKQLDIKTFIVDISFIKGVIVSAQFRAGFEHVLQKLDLLGILDVFLGRDRHGLDAHLLVVLGVQASSPVMLFPASGIIKTLRVTIVHIQLVRLAFKLVLGNLAAWV
jgi:hypothetical protein